MADEGPNYFDEPLTRFLDDAAAALPTPGGGSVASLVGALGTTMAQMSAAFTLKSKKYEQFHEAAMALVTRMSNSLDCDRVSIGFSSVRHIKVTAVSHSADFGKQTYKCRSKNVTV